jgi:hypothetical protein
MVSYPFLPRQKMSTLLTELSMLNILHQGRAPVDREYGVDDDDEDHEGLLPPERECIHWLVHMIIIKHSKYCDYVKITR